MTSNQPDRLDRIEQSLDRSTNLLERVIQVQATQQDTLETLVNSQLRQDAMIERLDAILERLIYREGRNNDQ